MKIELYNSLIYDITSEYIHNQCDESIARMYTRLLETLQDYIVKETNTYGDENNLHPDVEEVQNTINLVQKYL